MRNLIKPELHRLIEETTIIRVIDNLSHEIIYGDENSVSKYYGANNKQVILTDYDKYWQNKWNSFNGWDIERQDYRFLYATFRLFYFSFKQHLFYKNSSISETFSDQDKSLNFNDLAGVNLYGIYHHGKKCIDLLKKLHLIDKCHNKWPYLKKFSESRNKFIEHNYDPYGFTDIVIEPWTGGLSSTNSFLEIHLHKHNRERAFDVYLDYYEDYFKLEKIIIAIIESF